jgi:hypothetical protein
MVGTASRHQKSISNDIVHEENNATLGCQETSNIMGYEDCILSATSFFQ